MDEISNTNVVNNMDETLKALMKSNVWMKFTRKMLLSMWMMVIF